MEGDICRSNVLAPIWEVYTVALLSPRVTDEHTLLCTRSQLGEARGCDLGQRQCSRTLGVVERRDPQQGSIAERE